MPQINTRTLALKRAIAEAISRSGLPPCVAGLVLDVLRAEVSGLEAQALAREQQEETQEEQEAV